MIPNRAEIGLIFSKTLFQLLVGAIFLFLLFPTSVKAQTYPGCPSSYGGVCPVQLLVEKRVQNPKTGELVQIVSGNDATFAPDSQVTFRIEVKNIGAETVTGVSVQDQLPGNVNFVSSNPSSFSSSSNILSWTIDSLGVNESRFFKVVVQVKPQSELNFTIACETNSAQVQKDQQTASSSAVFCIQAQALQASSAIINFLNTNNNTNNNTQNQSVNVTQAVQQPQVVTAASGQVLGITQLPKTGLPGAILLLPGLLLPLGFRLRKFAVNSMSEEHSANYIYQMKEFIKRGGEIK